MTNANEPIALIGKPGEDNGMIGDVVNSIFQPGVNKGLHQFTNYAFIGLLVVLLALGIFYEFNIHVMFMLVLSTGLLIAINWFIEEQSSVIREKELQQAAEGEQEDTTQHKESTKDK